MKSTTTVRKSLQWPLGRRDSSIAKDFRHEGDSLFSEGELFEALESYNKSLCAAQLSSPEIPLAFAGRSSVYLEAKEYQSCLENIQLARDNGYPVENIDTLNIREVECKKLLECHKAVEDDDPWNFFKLSYPPNEKIPFIVDCVELQNSLKYGRFVITNQGQISRFRLSHNKN